MDVVDKTTRRRMMSGIRSKDTLPELLVRQGLHKRGFRFRLHDKNLPGKPDLILPKYRCVVFVHGCFWHLHECPLFKWPSTRADFWREKLEGNQTRDAKHLSELKRAGWRAAIVWECSFKAWPGDKTGAKPGGEKRRDIAIDSLANWLKNGDEFLSISGGLIDIH